jgi:hypothetical protein
MTIDPPAFNACWALKKIAGNTSERAKQAQCHE